MRHATAARILAWSMAALAPAASGAAGAPEDLALVNARVHTVSGASLDGAVLLLRGGKIEAVLPGGSEAPQGYRAVTLEAGSEIYPALIDADSDTGRTEIGSVRGTVDLSEVGDIHPDVRAEVAVNADSEHIPVTRSNGVLLCLTVPRGGMLSGTSALLRLEGRNFEEMLVKAPVASHLFWPAMKIDRSPGTGEEARKKKTPEEQEKARDEKLRSLRQAFADARAYLKAKQAGSFSQPPDPRWDALAPVIEGAMPLMVHASEIRQIRAALKLQDEEKIRVILAGGGDIWREAEEIGKRDIPVVLEGIQGLPARDFEPWDQAGAAARRLKDAGARFCIANGGGSSNARNLPYLAAVAVSRGLPREEALRSITLYAAQILGVDDRFGSIDPGKEATLFVANGDILDPRTRVLRAFIAGKEIDLSDRQKDLYERYRAR